MERSRARWIAAVSCVVLVAAAAGLWAGGARGHDGELASRKMLLREDLRVRLDGKPGRVTVLELEYPPGGSNPPHRHPGPVVVYILEGAVDLQIAGGLLKTYRKGETFFEPPGALHEVSRNASRTEPARLLAFLLAPADQGEMTLPPD
jgi:quercetin dioxygenase-like cupin family protein